MRPLTRTDFLPGADESARRVQAATALFGEAPRGVLTGAVAPRHARQRVSLTQAELKLLDQASLFSSEEVPVPNDAGLL
jgi:hypothetical protein